MSTIPDPGGEIAQHAVLVVHVTELAWLDPNITMTLPGVESKYVPLIATSVPPDAGPLAGDTDVTVGAGNMFVSTIVDLRPVA